MMCCSSMLTFRIRILPCSPRLNLSLLYSLHTSYWYRIPQLISNQPTCSHRKSERQGNDKCQEKLVFFYANLWCHPVDPDQKRKDKQTKKTRVWKMAKKPSERKIVQWLEEEPNICFAIWTSTDFSVVNTSAFIGLWSDAPPHRWRVMGSHNGMNTGRSRASSSVPCVTGPGTGSDTRQARLKTVTSLSFLIGATVA